jgi:hypothetical protein
MQIKSNLQYIEFVASAEDSEQQFGMLQIGITHEDFMLSLNAIGMHLDYKSLNANETAMAFALKPSQSLFVMEAEETCWRTTIHYTEDKGFMTANEIMHHLSLNAESLLELKASLIHNNYGKCKFTVFPKLEFFESAYQFKLGKLGNSYSSEIDYIIQHEY